MLAVWARGSLLLHCELMPWPPRSFLEDGFHLDCVCFHLLGFRRVSSSIRSRQIQSIFRCLLLASLGPCAKQEPLLPLLRAPDAGVKMPSAIRPCIMQRLCNQRGMRWTDPQSQSCLYMDNGEKWWKYKPTRASKQIGNKPSWTIFKTVNEKESRGNSVLLAASSQEGLPKIFWTRSWWADSLPLQPAKLSRVSWRPGGGQSITWDGVRVPGTAHFWILLKDLEASVGLIMSCPGHWGESMYIYICMCVCAYLFTCIYKHV